MAKNRVIGNNNKLPWKLPEDLRRFRKITSGHPVIMGRKTLDSLDRLLPGRENVVITRAQDYWPNFLNKGTLENNQAIKGMPSEGTSLRICHSLEEALEPYKSTDREVFILGGGEIFTLALPQMQRLYLTIIGKNFRGNAHFPKVNLNGYRVFFEEQHATSEGDNLPYKFIDYDKI